MQIIMRQLSDLVPYQKNTKKHNSEQIKNVAESIKQYGWSQPIVIDKSGTIIIGHCRYAAAKRLKLKEVPTVCMDDLTEKQVKALRIVDNKTNESAWDDDILKLEVPEVDLSSFDFGLDFLSGDDWEEQHEANKAEAQRKRENILNLAKGQFYAENAFDFPELDPVYELPPIAEWIDFDEVLREKEPEGKAVHFFCDDYKFERIWNHPEKYVDKLRRFACVATPDFSPYGDMPLIAQMWNHYRKHWVGAYLQENGVTVIPTIRASTDPRSLDFYLMGEPKNGIVIMSSMWTGNDDSTGINHEEYKRMKETLHPKKIFIYGKPGNMGVDPSDPVEYVERTAFRRKRSK